MPGKTLLETAESLQMTQKDLARSTSLSEQTIVSILQGEQPITAAIAEKLERATGVPASLWNNLELLYRQQLDTYPDPSPCRQ